MQLEQQFTISLPIEQAWELLLDVERIGPCFPGATITKVEGETVYGGVKVKLGPMLLAYHGTATFKETDHTMHRAVISAVGSDSKGNGTASAVVTASLFAQGEAETRCALITDLNITGRPSQFGRGIMLDIGNHILDQFAGNLAESIMAGSSTASESSGATPPDAGGDAIDLLRVARWAATKRVVPALLGVGIVVALIILATR